MTSTVPSPLEVRRRDRRQRLLAAALQLFAERGFHATSVDDVVTIARTSKSAFYAYFESKEDCFRVLLDVEGGALIDSVLNSTRPTHGGHRARVREGIFAFVRACCARFAVARLLLVEGVGLSESIEAVRGRLHDEFAGLVEAEVRRGQADGEFVGTDAAVYGRAVVGAVNEAIGWTLRTGEAADADRLATELCRIFGI